MAIGRLPAKYQKPPKERRCENCDSLMEFGGRQPAGRDPALGVKDTADATLWEEHWKCTNKTCQHEEREACA